MSKLVSVKADGSLDISVENHLFESIRKAHTWYTSKYINIPALIILAIIDIVGFVQIMNLTVTESLPSRIIITSALAIAFDVAPLYIGYALCLKAYKLGKAIHNWILGFSIIACILGIVGNTYFRFMTMGIAYQGSINGEPSDLALPLTVLMCLLPIITSLVNLTIGCLTFDPLLFDMLRLSKKLRQLKLRKRQIEAYLEEFTDENTLKQMLVDNEDRCYENTKREIYALRSKLKTYTIAKISGVHIK